MTSPDPEALRDALAAIEDEDAERCRSILEGELEAGPPASAGYAELDDEDASIEEKAWACVALASDRLDEGKFAIVRVTLRSAIDHAEGTVEERDGMQPGDGGLFG